MIDIAIYEAKRKDNGELVRGDLIRTRTCDRMSGTTYLGYYIKDDFYRLTEHEKNLHEIDPETLLIYKIEAVDENTA